MRAPASMLAVAAIAASLAGCQVRDDFSGTAFRCDDQPICPSGYDCVAGACVACAGPSCGGAAGGADGGGANASGLVRHILTLAGAPTADLDDVPVLVRLTPDRIDYGRVAPGGADLRFADATGAVLPHEIERWDATGESIVWVGLPHVHGSADWLAMSYGDGVASASAARDVWTGYDVVYHLGDDTADSSASQLDGTDHDTAPITGAVGGARGFDGASAYVDLGRDRDFVRAAPGFTLEAWIRPARVQAGIGVVFAASIDNQDLPTTSSRAQLLVEGAESRGGARSDDLGNLHEVAAPAPAVGRWTFCTVVADFAADTLTLYFDGHEVASQSAVGFSATSPDRPSTQAGLGVDDDLASSFFAGGIDEVRLAPRPRSPAWVELQDLAQHDALLHYGAGQAP